ncbi:peroxiredoxin [Coprothermobacter platensis]|jgi:peroxiredoxin|uniref:peroxiredoxin n=1 Tax=Coprothermobacter platensis TaxID=108819 RepID=UPI000368670F|nr:peroxiredoxin [Coprothermobacter platensis]
MLTVGSNAPDFELVDHNMKKVKLSSLTGKVVLAFYPGAFTSVCTKEMCTFRDMMARFNDLKTTVFGISVDTPFSNKAFADQNGIEFPLLSDFGGEVAKQYGGVHNNFADVPNYTVAKRAVYVIDNGKVVYAWVSEDPGKEPPYDDIVKAAEG